MRKITPFTTLPEAVRSLDNGGRFFDLFSKAKDGVISAAELGKASQNLLNMRHMILFLELTMSRLDANERNLLLAKLNDTLQQHYQKYHPHHLPESQLAELAPEDSVFLRGTPRPFEPTSDFQAYLSFPLVINNITIPTWVPLADSYTLYQLSMPEATSPVLLAHPKGKSQLPPQPLALTGMVKTFKTGEAEDAPERKYVEIVYYCEE